MKCKVCKKVSNAYAIKIEVGNYGPPRDGSEVLADVCSKCGNMSLRGAHLNYMKKLASTGFPDITKKDISKVLENIPGILRQMILPGRFVDEKKVWIDPIFANHGQYGETREIEYQETFGEFDGNVPEMVKSRKIKGKYARLIHFLLMDNDEREEHFGGIMCPALEITNEGFITFRDGYHRFTLLRFLGADKIPVAMTDESIRNAKNNGIQVW